MVEAKISSLFYYFNKKMDKILEKRIFKEKNRQIIEKGNF